MDFFYIKAAILGCLGGIVGAKLKLLCARAILADWGRAQQVVGSVPLGCFERDFSLSYEDDPEVHCYGVCILIHGRMDMDSFYIKAAILGSVDVGSDAI